MSTIMQRARAADAGAAHPSVKDFFGEPRHDYTARAEALQASITLNYLSGVTIWPESIEGHWANIRHAVSGGIHPDALDRAEEAILKAAHSPHGVQSRQYTDLQDMFSALRCALPRE